MVNEQKIEYGFIGDLQRLKYTYRDDIRDNAELERNFRQKFETLNRVTLSDAEFSRLRDEIVNPDVFQASKTLRARNTFIREDGTPLQYTLVGREELMVDFEKLADHWLQILLPHVRRFRQANKNNRQVISLKTLKKHWAEVPLTSEVLQHLLEESGVLPTVDYRIAACIIGVASQTERSTPEDNT